MNKVDKMIAEAADKINSVIDVEWDLGFQDKGHGHLNFAVIVKDKETLVVECESKEIAEHIVEIHNKRKENT